MREMKLKFGLESRRDYVRLKHHQSTSHVRFFPVYYSKPATVLTDHQVCSVFSNAASALLQLHHIDAIIAIIQSVHSSCSCL